MRPPTPEKQPMSTTVSLIAAVAANGVIGVGGALPWRLSADMRRFKRLTIGKPVIMGRTTADSLNGPLMDRSNIVMTSKELTLPGFIRVTSPEEAFEVAEGAIEALGGDEIMVIGGGQIYDATIARAHRLYITHVLAELVGDTHFPEIDPGLWEVVLSEDIPPGDRDSHATRFVVYERHEASAA